MRLRHDPALVERARRLLADGASRREVARTLGVHHKTIGRWFPDSGWSRREAGEWTAFIRWYDTPHRGA